MEISRVTY